MKRLISVLCATFIIIGCILTGGCQTPADNQSSPLTESTTTHSTENPVQFYTTTTSEPITTSSESN